MMLLALACTAILLTICPPPPPTPLQTKSMACARVASAPCAACTSA